MFVLYYVLIMSICKVTKSIREYIIQIWRYPPMCAMIFATIPLMLFSDTRQRYVTKAGYLFNSLLTLLSEITSVY